MKEYNFDKIIHRENTSSIKYDLRKKLFGREDIMPLWVADMDFETPDFIREAIIDRARHPVYGYSFRDDAFFHSVMSWMEKRHDWPISQKWISFSPGIVPALNMAVMTYSEPGDGIIVQPPVYFPFFTAVGNHSRNILNNELINRNGRYHIDFDDLETKAKKASMLLLCHPHNPVGRAWDEEELQKIIDICHRNKVVIISDEIHSDLILNDNQHFPLLKYPGADEITVACYAPSKTFNLAGMATSFLVTPNRDLRDQYEKTLDAIHIGMGNIFGKVALQAAYDHGEEWLEQLLEYLSKNLSFLEKFIQEKIPEIKVTKTEATYLIWLDFRALKMSDKELKRFVIEQAGLGLNDGPAFGFGGQGFQRINIALPRKQLEVALTRLENAIKNWRK